MFSENSYRVFRVIIIFNRKTHFDTKSILTFFLGHPIEQQIEVILICVGWEGAIWWPQLVELRTEMAAIRLPAAEDCFKFPKGSTEELPKLDPLYTFHISGKVV